MLQQHATCLQQHIKETTTTITTSTWPQTTKAKTSTAIKYNLICLNNKHENSLKTHLRSQQGITVNLKLPLAAGTHLNSSNNNVALHRSSSSNNIKSNNNNSNNVNETLATTWALNLLKTTKQNAQQQQQQQQQQKPTEIKPGLANNKALKPRLIFYTENSQKAQILKERKLLNESNMLPLTQKQESLDSQKQESLDFNSKRRRGRLRLSYEIKQNLLKKEKQQQQPQQLEYNVPAILFINNVAKVITTLLLTYMLAFIKQIKQHKFVYKPQQQQQKSKKTVKQQPQQNSPYKKPAENLVLSLIKQIIIKTKTNNYNKQKRKQTSTTLSSSSSAAASSNSNNNPLLLYAFLFLITLLILPCHQPHNGLAEAAKPKSATQHSNNNINNNNNHLQHQQQHQQDKPNIAYAAGADNVHIDKQGTVLTPPSYHVVSSQTSNEEETEYILDSDERNFDLENESINEVNEDQEDDMQEQERDSYEKYDNGKFKLKSKLDKFILKVSINKIFSISRSFLGF
ncbi:probable basic-leucine zipper transcription factor R [Lucilia cuprina]|uniref:probable basic-leucine zipper transcription factor R n=1 Tax=Lucilia cuprina TaxID=7375 RepID=UPI001F053C72|nr:probable basic-leucine zipper transcription factor R [Lucilia cuprina]